MQTRSHIQTPHRDRIKAIIYWPFQIIAWSKTLDGVEQKTWKYQADYKWIVLYFLALSASLEIPKKLNEFNSTQKYVRRVCLCVKHLLLKMALNCKISNSFSRAIHMTSISFPLRRMGLGRAVAFHFIVCTISLVGRFGGTKKIRHTYTRHTNTQCICSTLYLMTINMYYPISPFWLARTIRWLKKPNQFFQLITMVYATHTSVYMYATQHECY